MFDGKLSRVGMRPRIPNAVLACRIRIQGCTDMAILDRWIDNVFGARTIADVLT